MSIMCRGRVRPFGCSLHGPLPIEKHNVNVIITLNIERLGGQSHMMHLVDGR